MPTGIKGQSQRQCGPVAASVCKGNLPLYIYPMEIKYYWVMVYLQVCEDVLVVADVIGFWAAF